MLHTDEGVLHSYLDGALRTDERLEVESHVAGCVPCAAALQEARQLKSQASKILSKAQPPPVVRPPRSMPDRRRKRPFIPVAWAASLAVALAAGWTARTLLRQTPAGSEAQAAIAERDLGMAGAAVDEVANGTADLGGLASATTPAEGAAEPEATTTPGRQEGAAPAGRRPAARVAQPTAAAAEQAEMVKAAAPPARQLADRATADQAAREEAAVTTALRRDQAANEARIAGAAPQGAAARGAPTAPSVRPVYAVPLVEALPTYTVVAVATAEHPLLVVTQLSAAGDTVVLVYERSDTPEDSRRIFEQGIVLERDSTGQPLTVIGRYRTIGNYRITARSSGGISRDSLATLLDLLDARELR